jgi:peroxiredoxin Q/BCP
LGAEVVAISTDDLAGATSIVGRVGIPFPILYNSDGDVVRAYGVYNLLGDSLAAPATFIIDTDGVVRWSHIGRGISDRPKAAKVIRELRRLES